jgi:hypothetical protein
MAAPFSGWMINPARSGRRLGYHVTSIALSSARLDVDTSQIFSKISLKT